MPVAKYALSGSRLRFSNGSTAMLFSGIPASEKALAGLVGGRCQNNHVVITSALAIKTAATTIARFGRAGVDVEIVAPIFFLPRRCLNFSGGSGLPISSVYRF